MSLGLRQDSNGYVYVCVCLCVCVLMYAEDIKSEGVPVLSPSNSLTPPLPQAYFYAPSWGLGAQHGRRAELPEVHAVPVLFVLFVHG